MTRENKSSKNDNVILGKWMAAIFWAVLITRYGIWGFVVPFVLLSVYLYVKWWNRQCVRHSGIDFVDKMTGREFEEYLGGLFQAHGYNAKVTKRSGDYGADLVIRKKRSAIVVQAKRYSKNIGVKAIQEIHAAKSVYKAREAWVVTNRNFTKQARTLADATGVKLIGRDGLITLIYQANKKQRPIFSFRKRSGNLQDVSVTSCRPLE